MSIYMYYNDDEELACFLADLCSLEVLEAAVESAEEKVWLDKRMPKTYDYAADEAYDHWARYEAPGEAAMEEAERRAEIAMEARTEGEDDSGAPF